MPSALEVLRLRDFRMVFGASVVSLLGDGMVPVAIAFAVLDLTGSATDLGIVLAARSLALIGSLLVGGVVADRLSRRAVMIGADVVRLVGQGLVAALLLAGDATVAMIAVSAALIGAGTGFFNPAWTGLIPLVAGDRLQQANSLRGIASAAGSIVGPALAGVLVAAASPGVALLIDAVSFGVSAMLLGRVVTPMAVREAPERFLTELRAGFTEFRARTWVWATVAIISVVNGVAVAFSVLGALVAKQHLGGPGAWALILTVEGIGSLLAGVTLLRLRPRRPLLAGVVIGLLPVGPTLLLAIPARLAIIAIAALAAGLGGMTFNVLWETTLQEHIPPEARSRVSSYDWFGSLAFQAIGFALVGPLAAGIGVSTALLLCGGIELVAVLSLLGVADIRTLRQLPVPSGARSGAA